jgi:LmbE family N-acetylglucosaminyl deacetylase
MTLIMYNLNSNEIILIVAAHSDDEVLGCGGTMLRHIARGDEVHVVFLTNGVGARGSDDGVNERSAACENVMNKAGVSSFSCFDYPDNQLDKIALLEVVKVVEDAITAISPTIIYTHFEGDLNIDHRICSSAVSTACRPLPGTEHAQIFAFEVPSSTEWSTSDNFKPTHFVNIEEFLDAKLSLMCLYEDEIRSFPHPRSLEAIGALAKWRGSTAGFQAAEAFVSMQTRWK